MAWIILFLWWSIGTFVMCAWWRLYDYDLDISLDVEPIQIIIFSIFGWIVSPFFLLFIIWEKTKRKFNIPRIVIWKGEKP